MGRSKVPAPNREFLPFVVSFGSVNMLGSRLHGRIIPSFRMFVLGSKSPVKYVPADGWSGTGKMLILQARVAECATMTAVTVNKILECEHSQRLQLVVDRLLRWYQSGSAFP